MKLISYTRNGEHISDINIIPEGDYIRITEIGSNNDDLINVLSGKYP